MRLDRARRRNPIGGAPRLTSAGLATWASKAVSAILIAAFLVGGPSPLEAAVAAGSRRSSDRAVRSEAGARRILPAYRTVVLSNGLTLMVMEQHELPLVNFRMILKAGSAADPKGREGLASMTADLLRQGTKSKSATVFSEAVDFLGGSLESSADRDKTMIAGEFLSRDFREGLGLLSEMVTSPAFRDEEVERTRQQTLAEIQQDLDDPGTIADKQFALALYRDHPYARPPEGSVKSVPALTRSDITGFYRAFYVPNNAILAVVGDVSASQAVDAVRQAFGRWEKRPVPKIAYPAPPAIEGKRVVIVDKPDVNQTQIRIGTIGIRRSDPVYFPAQIGATILGGGFTSWLNQEIREKRGLSYGASARFETRLEPGPFLVSTFTKNETVKDTISVALEVLGRFREGRLTTDDLTKAQSYRAGQFPLTVETTDQLAAQITDLAFYGLGREFVDKQIERLRGVTLSDLRGKVAPRIPGNDYVLVVVTNASQVRPQLEGFGSIEVVPLAPESGEARGSSR